MILFRKPKQAELILSSRHELTRFGTRRTVQLKHPRLPKSVRADGVWFDISMDLPEPFLQDGLVFGFLHYAMKHKAGIRIAGRVSRQALRNAQTYQEAWHCWLPDEYQPIEIVPDEVVPDENVTFQHSAEAIACYSGGVDATFLALRHVQNKPESYALKKVITVHGFDIPLKDASEFKKLVLRTDDFLRSIGLQRITVVTNTRAPELIGWEHSFGPQMACMLHQFAGPFKTGMIASSDTYAFRLHPWGSSPSTDYLMSGGNFQIVHDGAGFLRTEKVELIAKSPVAVAALKVCWEGKRKGENCGHCEKCVRTRLNLLAVGLDHPACFSTPFREEMIDSLIVRNSGQLSELLQIQTYARRHGVQTTWTRRLDHRIVSVRESLNRQDALV